MSSAITSFWANRRIRTAIFFLLISMVFFTDLPLWVNTQFTKLRLKGTEEAITGVYGQSVYNMEIKVRDVNNQEILLSSFKGQPLFINFWASWCTPCLAEFSSLQEMSAKFKEASFVFISTENKTAFDQYLSKTNHSLDFYRLDSAIPKELGSKVLPVSFLLNANGEVVFRHYGAANWSSNESLMQLKNALNAN